MQADHYFMKLKPKLIATSFFIYFTIVATCTGFAGELKPTSLSYNKGLDGWRFGLGLGYALYVGDQMDFTLTRNFGDFKELRTNLVLGAYQVRNQENEWGFTYKHGSFQTLKSENTQGIQCNYNEIQIMFQHSLNENVGLNAGNFTCNLQYGFGAMSYKSMYFTINPNFQTIDVIKSSVGYGLQSGKDINGFELEHIPGKKIALLGNVGINLGFKVGRNLILYVENSFQASLSNKLSGNLSKISVIPPDCYFYTGLALYYRFGGSIGRLGCPKLWYH